MEMFNSLQNKLKTLMNDVLLFLHFNKAHTDSHEKGNILYNGNNIISNF